MLKTPRNIGGEEQGPATSKPRLGGSLALWQDERQLHGTRPDASAYSHVHGSEVPRPVVPIRIMVGNRQGDVVVDIHHQGSSLSDRGQSTIAIPEDRVVDTEGLGHYEEMSPLTCVEPAGH